MSRVAHGYSNGYGKSEKFRGDGVKNSFSNGDSTRTHNEVGEGVDVVGSGWDGELGELQEEEIIWGDTEADTGFRPATTTVQKTIDVHITLSDNGNSQNTTRTEVAVTKAKISSLLTMEMQKASISLSSSSSSSSSSSLSSFTAGRLRSLSMVKDQRVGLALLEPSVHHDHGGGNLKYINNHHSSNGNCQGDDVHGERIPQSAPVSAPMWMRRSHSCFVTEAEKQEAEAEAAAEGKKEIKKKNADYIVRNNCNTASGYGDKDGEGDEDGSDHYEVYGGDEHDKQSRNGGGGMSWIPPHEIVARSQSMTFSVCEGAGRTLKGMDLRRVRNAVWSRTGFVD